MMTNGNDVEPVITLGFLLGCVERHWDLVIFQALHKPIARNC
jgi:hypothetical protein